MAAVHATPLLPISQVLEDLRLECEKPAPGSVLQVRVKGSALIL